MSAFFSKERMDALKQQAKDVKAARDAFKEKQAEVKRRQQAEKDYQKEKKATFEGTALQPVGIIPKSGKVILRLDPDAEILSIQYDKDINVKLPYARVLGFRLECITEEMADNKTDLAGLVLSSGLLGRGIVGTASKLAGGIMLGKKKKKVVWVGTLIYKDKEGLTQELSFAGGDRELESDDTPYKSIEDEQFEHIVNGIAMRANQDLLEL